MWDQPEANTEVCSVCKTSYPRCLTCTQYGRKDKHQLDTDKANNSHDNSSYINDKGEYQPSWNKKNKIKQVNINPISFSEEMWFQFFLLLNFFPINNTFPLRFGNIKTPLNDPHGERDGTLSSNQFKSNFYCGCSCYRRSAALRVGERRFVSSYAYQLHFHF